MKLLAARFKYFWAFLSENYILDKSFYHNGNSPKSANLSSPVSLMSRFCGLTSLWRIRLLWQYERPRRSWNMKILTFFGCRPPGCFSKYWERSVFWNKSFRKELWIPRMCEVQFSGNSWLIYNGFKKIHLTNSWVNTLCLKTCSYSLQLVQLALAGGGAILSISLLLVPKHGCLIALRSWLESTTF